MTKTISLADDAYDALVAVRLPKESFSSLARRAARELARRRLFDSARPPIWTAGEERDLVDAIYSARDASRQSRVPP